MNYELLKLSRFTND